MSVQGQLRPGRASSKCGHVRDAPEAEIAQSTRGFATAALPPGNGYGDRFARTGCSASCASARRVAQKSDLSWRINVICPVQSPWQKYFCFSEMQIGLHDLPSRPERGALAIVTNVGRGAVDAAVPARMSDRRADLINP